MLILSSACAIGGVPIPDYILNTISYVIDFIKIGIPLLLIIFGMLDLAKGVVAKKDEDMKKYQRLFLKKLIAGAMVFFVVSITIFLLKLLDSAETSGRRTNDYEALKCIQEIIKALNQSKVHN